MQRQAFMLESATKGIPGNVDYSTRQPVAQLASSRMTRR